MPVTVQMARSDTSTSPERPAGVSSQAMLGIVPGSVDVISTIGAVSSAQCLGRSVLVGIHSDGCPRAQPLPGGRQAMTGNLREWCSGGMFLACFLQIAGCDRMRLR